MNTEPQRSANREHGSLTILAIGLAAALLIGGAVLVVATDQDPAPENAPTSTSAADQQAAETEAEQTAEPVAVDWAARIPTTVCAPSGPDSCMGLSNPQADDRLDTGIQRDLATVDLTMTWEADSPATHVLEIAVVSGHTECDGRCFYAYHMVTVQGTSPLTVDAEDLELQPEDSVWLTVDTPRLTPSPVYAKAHHGQDVHVTGTLVPVLEA